MKSKLETSRLLVSCPDQRGIVAAVTSFLYAQGANILHSDQHSDPEQGHFTLRVEWDRAGFQLSDGSFAPAFREIADRFAMQWRLSHSDRRRRVAVFVSSQLHCLADLLYRRDAGELDCEIPLVIGNHPVGEALARFHGVDFHHLPLDAGSDKAQVERQQRKLLSDHAIDLVVLARYMQILSPEFVAAYAGQVINIHHSFLPAFIGAKPYHQAYARGVKLIGATSHYVTEVLDEGPIIAQDVTRITHRDPIEGLVEKGRDLERVVLSRAVRLHLEDRVVVHGNKTVVFE